MIPKGFFLDYILLIPIASFVVAHILKGVIRYATKATELKDIFRSGGMPSVHSAFIVSLTVAIGFKEGFNSAIFALAVILSGIILYDAMNVRLESQKHAISLNRIRKYLQGKVTIEKHLEYIGHTSIEVCGGGILGVIIGVVLSLI